ncbi:MAG: hypothetical protein J7623_30880 [Chitinophaga sp.]|uniref:hypothetical protein n=1 Tax=Chitinophaga sp. TaxID=1869181 RepID=UPI001B09FCF2|nr:hypothetical protein [Chitinophaga sp.]MBO9733086.1 hypothetical protein [Chitinophaga sp.]
MQQFRIGLAIAIAVLSACNSGNQNVNGTTGKEEAAVHPATPAGTIDVTITDRDKDTSQVTIKFKINGQEKEKTFEQSLLKDAADADLFKVLWDAPNSAYVGVMKANHQPRYYHASISDKNDLKILWFASPDKRIWSYMEDSMGLGKVAASGEMVQQYKKSFQSGKILADFIANIKPGAAADNVELYVEYGGFNKSMTIPVPKGSKAVIKPTAEQDHVYFSFVTGNKVEPVIDLHVENGRLQVKALKEL